MRIYYACSLCEKSVNCDAAYVKSVSCLPGGCFSVVKLRSFCEAQPYPCMNKSINHGLHIVEPISLHNNKKVSSVLHTKGKEQKKKSGLRRIKSMENIK